VLLKQPAAHADDGGRAVTPPPDTTAATPERHAAPEPGARHRVGDTASSTLVESYRRLADVFHEVLSEQSLDLLLERVARTLDALVPNDGMTFYEADEGTRRLHAVFAIGTDAAQVLADEPFPFGEGITGWAAEQREPVLANNAHLDPRVRWVADTDTSPESLIAVPLIARGYLKGTLNIYRDGRQTFSDEEYDLAKRFADAAALAIDNAHIRASLEHQARTDPLTGLLNHRSFHEQLRAALVRTSSQRAALALVVIDVDDFKRVNDVYGHAIGDQVLAEIADVLRGAVRGSDAVCRIGGEEFAVIAPAADETTAVSLAERIAARFEANTYDTVGQLTASIGVALGPEHAANPRELVACAEVAMMAAKASGKKRIVVFGTAPDEVDGPAPPARPDEFRSIAHLKMLHGVSSKLSRLNDVAAIGQTIADELRLLVDYHNCRVFLRRNEELHPVAFRGELSSRAGEAIELLTTTVGVGITGHVAATGAPFVTGDASQCEIGRRIDGTEHLEESLLAVPLTYGGDVVGVIVVSKLGLDQFDSDDVRLLEVLAGHASVALVNAQLYEAQRREAENAKALLELARELAGTRDLETVLRRVVDGTARILASRAVSVWLPSERAEVLECRAIAIDGMETSAAPGARLAAGAAAPFARLTEPFLVPRDEVPPALARALLGSNAEGLAIAPLITDAGWGSLSVAVSDAQAFDGGRLELLGGIANQAKLAITNASGFESLERTFVSTVEALANALEANDEYTSSHARWIRDTALNVGTELGLDAAALKRLELGALFHDIGKIGIPAAILAKPGVLTHDERHLIQRHPELGERILGPIEQLAGVRPIVRACHERWDGRGYPDGLAGEEIPLEARIIFACDAFHAMTTDRPYRRRLSAETALERLAEGAGTQFDPAVIDVCLRVLEAPAAA
jgi:diguanylate cyclase (GGDEF)-like protein